MFIHFGLFAFITGEVKDVLSNSSDCSDAVSKEELPISFSHLSKKHDLASNKAWIEGNRIHVTNSFIVLIVVQR